MTELTRLAASGVPEWVGLALTVLGIAASVARQQRRSARTQGERLGELERRAELERTRRLQVEAVLADYNVDLPWWPPDGPNQRRPEPRYRDDDRDQVDDRDDAPATTRAPSVPPLPDYPHHRRQERIR